MDEDEKKRKEKIKYGIVSGVIFIITISILIFLFFTYKRKKTIADEVTEKVAYTYEKVADTLILRYLAIKGTKVFNKIKELSGNIYNLLYYIMFAPFYRMVAFFRNLTN